MNFTSTHFSLIVKNCFAIGTLCLNEMTSCGFTTPEALPSKGSDGMFEEVIPITKIDIVWLW